MFEKVIDRTGTGSLKWDRYKDPEILPMWVADMDFHSPEPVIDALKTRAEHGVFGYTIPYKSLNDTVLRYLEHSHGFSCQPEWLVWLPGLVPALNLICRAFEGTVLTATPIYPPFLSAPPYSGRPIQKVPLQLAGDRWEFDWDALEAATTADTRVLLLCNPHNPVGRVFTRDELEKLAQYAQRHDLVVSADEIHSDLILEPDLRHIPFATLGDDSRERSISLFAPSKTYNLPGLSCAFAVIPNPKLRAAFNKAARGIVTEINAMGYAACEAAYKEGEPWRTELLAQLRRNRDRVLDFIRGNTPEIGITPIEATYLAWLDVRSLELDDPAAHFLKHGLALSDGKLFGAPGYLRLNFGCPPQTLQSGLDRLLQGVQSARSSTP